MNGLDEMFTAFDFEPVMFASVPLTVYDYTAHGDAAIWQAVLVGFVHFAAKAGCEVIAEGIETEAELAVIIGAPARHVTVGASWISSLFDQYVVDGLVNGLADTLQAGFRLFRRAQTGRLPNYALVMGGGLFAIVAVYLLFR